MAKRRVRRATVWTAALGMLAIVAMPAAAGALTAISQGYSTDEKLAAGSLVSLKNNSTDTVSAASINNVNGILGVVISDGNSLLSLTSEEKSQVQVATSGVVQVLASNINGDIAQGDQVTASPINGVGMKASSSVKVVGIAQEKLAKEHGSIQKYKDKSGQEKSVLVGQVPVLVSVAYFFKQPEKTIIPSAIQNVANALAGKQVSTLPILISLGIFLVTLIIVVSVIYSLIRSSIISVGRNPMSQSAVLRGVFLLSALVLGVLVVAVVSIYMILTRL